LLQFRLKTLLAVVALCSAAFAVMAWIGAVWSMVLLFFVALIAGHVVGNAIGTKLRGGRPKRPPPEPMSATATQRPSVPAEAPPRLGTTASLHRVAFVVTCAGCAAGALTGRLIFLQVDHGQLRAADWVLALVSFAVLGGFLAFLASSFFQIGLWPAAVCFFSRQNAQAELAPALGESQE
jgi:hypothetical protein